MLRLWVRHKYRPPEGTSERVRKMKIMDVPWWEVGCVGMERTGVSFHNLAPEKTKEGGEESKDPENDANVQIALTHPSITGAGLTDSQTEQIFRQQELLYPHRRPIIIPQGIAQMKPREPLLRPDELVVKESVRRRLSMHKKWVHMMLYGVCDEGGFTLPIWTEEELLRMQRGLRPRVKVKKDGEDGRSGGEEDGKGKEKGKEKQIEKGGETPQSAKWTSLPAKGPV